jgi:acetyl esterase/lipase
VTEDRSVLSRSAEEPNQTIAYGPDRDQVVELFEPIDGLAPASGPVVALVHGGFWSPDHDRRHLRPMAEALTRCGRRVVNVEYRRPPQLGWSAMSQDLLSAVACVGDLRWTRSRPVVWVGHSAGGQLVLWLAAQPCRGVARVVALAPVADLPSARRSGLGDDAVGRTFADAATTAEDSAEAGDESIDAADPMRAPPRVPVTVVHGTDDMVVPVALSRTYCSRYGVPLVEYPVGHFALIDPRSAAWAPVRSAVLGDGP